MEYLINIYLLIIDMYHCQTCAEVKNQDSRSAGSDDKIECQDPRSTGFHGKITDLVRIQDLQDLTTKQKFRI